MGGALVILKRCTLGLVVVGRPRRSRVEGWSGSSQGFLIKGKTEITLSSRLWMHATPVGLD